MGMIQYVRPAMIVGVCHRSGWQLLAHVLKGVCCDS